MRRVLSALALALLVLGLVAPPAPAKGPTHLLLMGVSPSGVRGTQLMELSDSRASEIEVLLGQLGEKVTEPVYEKWQEVQVAWTVHAFDIFRSDIVFVDGKGNAVVMTLHEGFVDDDTSTDWRRVENGEALTEAFDELGLLKGSEVADPSAATSADTDATAAGAGTTTPSGPVADTAGSSDSGAGAWRWALPALLAGLVLGAVGSGVLRRRTPQSLAQRFASS